MHICGLMCYATYNAHSRLDEESP